MTTIPRNGFGLFPFTVGNVVSFFYAKPTDSGKGDRFGTIERKGVTRDGHNFITLREGNAYRTFRLSHIVRDTVRVLHYA